MTEAKENLYLEGDKAKSFDITLVYPPPCLHFLKDGETIGIFSITDQGLHFEGDADRSARIFIDKLIKEHCA